MAGPAASISQASSGGHKCRVQAIREPSRRARSRPHGYRSLKHTTIQDQAHGDTRSKVEKGQVTSASASTQGCFGQRRRFDVVHDPCVEAERLAQDRGEMQGSYGEIGRIDDRPVLNIHIPWRTDADSYRR